MSIHTIEEIPDSDKVFHDTVFVEANKHLANQWIRIAELYPGGIHQPLLPSELSREQFGQGNHYECFMLTALSTLVRFPRIIQNCFVSKNPRRDGRYTFQFFRGKEWVKVEIDDYIPLEDGEELYIRSPTEHWWPLLLEKAYAKFYTGYENLEGCTLQEAYHDLTGNPVLNIPIDSKLAKAAGADVTEGHYWLGLAQNIQSGQFVASVLTKDMELESMGLQREQQYGILEIFSMTGTSSVNDIVVHLHNPFEDDEFRYTGPLNSKDLQWTPKLRAKYNVDDEHSIFLPLNTFLKIINSMQLCYISPVESDATYFDDEWKGESAGGNPTSVTWRKNPLYCVQNTGNHAVRLVVMIKQEDQRRFTSLEENAQYLQCGVVLIQNSYGNQIPTYFVTGNNHKPIHKSLFLNSREVANTITIPPNSLCYLVPSCMSRGAEGKFTLALYRMVGEDYSSLLIKKLSIPEMDWAHPAVEQVNLEQKQKDRVDFYVDQETDIHILMHQLKPYVSPKTGGDAMAQDYMGMYLYDDTDRKIAGVHAATNFREIGIVFHLPRSGRYALSVTCPRGKGQVPALITIVGSSPANARVVEPPEDAGMFDDDDDIIDEGDDATAVSNPIDYTPIRIPVTKFTELPDSNTPFEDKRFMVDNRAVTNDPWIHIGDLYPEGKTQPLLPDRLSRDQFEQGEHFECCCLTAFASLVDHHPDVIRNVFVTKQVRRDGRYTFQFHRYGQWVKVEIDDRIPLTEQQTLFCRSPTRHWWPLLLEKACAKFYTLYQNLEGCSLQELYYDFTGQPVMSIPTDLKLAKSSMHPIDDPDFWTELNDDLKSSALGAFTSMEEAEAVGMQGNQTYGILAILSTKNDANVKLSDLLVMIYNPFVEATYTGPMNSGDSQWTPELRSIFAPERSNVIYMPVPVFCDVFVSMHQVHIKGLLSPSWHFNSEWGEGTNGGNPTLVTWRENPLYLVRNPSDEPLQIMAMIGQPDQRHRLHLLPEQELNYIQCGLVLSQCTSSNPLPTYLVTGNNHRIVNKGLFVDSRESANRVTIPPKSLCYLVPSAMFRDKGKFLLSYWYQKAIDAKQMKLVRLKVDVARHLPAIEHLELRNREKDCVDFLVDVPTDIHILLRQEKPFKSSNGGDAMAEDFLGMYLYDGNDKRIQGVTSATNYREMGIVHHLPDPGRYALCVTCPRGHGTVPCKVEVIGVEAAHVRITDPPEGAGELGEIDLDFLDLEPEGVPLDDLALDDDEIIQGLLADLKELHKDFDNNGDAIAALEHQVNDRAHAMAKKVIGKDRPKYLPGHDLNVLNPLLDSNKDYMSTEHERFIRKKDPRNGAKVQTIEEVLQRKANDIAQQLNEPDLSFIDPAPEGIPIQDIPLMGDAAFSAMARERMKLKRDPAANASKINDLEEKMNDLAHELANQMHARERTFLDPEPEGVPLELLSLNDNATLSKLECDLRALNRKPRKDAKAIAATEDKISDHVYALARELKNNERDIFLDPQPEGVPVADLHLDSDEAFHAMEVERLFLRKEDPQGNMNKIKDLENAMNDRARELARAQVSKNRGFLDPEPFGFPLEELGLEFDDAVAAEEAKLRELKRDPKRNAAGIKATEGAIANLVDGIARKKAELDRAFLDPEPEGRLVWELPLNDDKPFVGMDTKRRQLLRRGEDPAKVKALEDAMNDGAHEMARALNAKERPDYLSTSPCGIPLEDLPLDSDPEFRELEAKRQQLKRDPMRKAVLAEVEAALNARAEELAKRQLANDRGYLNPTPDGVPVYLLPLDDDPPFQALEAKRAQLKKNPRRNAKAIHDMEDDLNDRALELATELKASERKKFLNPKPNGIPIADVPINNDGLFRDMEIQRLILREDPVRNATAISNLEDALNERALELAAKMLADERAFLDPEPLGIPLVELPLDDNERFLEMEAKLRELRKKGNREDPTIAGLERDLNDVVRQISAEELEKDRDFLDPEPEGRLLEDLPLRNDKEFHGLEKKRFYLKKDPKKNSQKLADIEELMNERAHQIAKALNASERKNYLDHFPKGVPLEDLPLDTDGEFSKLEAKLAQLMRNPRKHKAAIKDLQDALNLRAEELAQEKLQDERSFMDPEPEGIPLKYLPLDEDSIFHEKETERLALKAENSRKNDERLKTLEGEMMDRANKLAVEMKLKGRDAVLDKAPKGVPLDILPLDDDMPFADLEVEYLKVLGDGEDPSKTQNLADAMRKRAEDMANKVKADSRMNLEQNPLGIPLEELPLEKNKDFDAQERELFVLKRDPTRNADAIRDAIDKLNALVFEMAKECVGLQRDFLDPEPEGRYLSELPLNTDPTFLGLEKQRRELKKDPYANEDRVADLEQMMNDRAHELAKKMNAMERPSYMEPAYHGVPASALPLDGDKEFGNLEAERARLCHEPGKNSSQIAKVEAALNQRAEGMAAEALRQDRMFLGEEVEGVPVRHLPLNDDAEFSRLEAKRATLKNSDPGRNMKAIKDLEEQMMDRAVDLANELKGDLRSLLDQRPLGVPLESLPLDDDGCFFDLEENYRELSADSANRGKLDDILDQLNERARELAQDLHDKERSVLEQRPEGVPLSALPLNTDKEFNALETEARTLRNIPSGRGKNAARLKELEGAMNRRAVELANESRKAFCDATPEGIPLELLKLGDMDEFTRLEEELRELRKDPGTNKEAISDLEYDLNNKAHEAAREIMEGDRGYLDPKPCGVSLSVLPIGSDPTFHALEVERGKLKAANTHGNTRQIKDLEEKLNDRLRALAEEQKAEDLSGLDEEPEGVPLSELKLHDDDVFDNMVGAIRDLKRNPNKNSDLIDDLRERMNDRAHELAQEKLRADRAFLDKNPQGVPLEILPLSTDPQFRRLEAERAKLKAQDPRRNAKNIRDLEDALNNRSHELARDQLREDLTGVNDMPRDIPLEALQPHSDPAFAELVNEIRALKADPNANANEIERVLHAMNNRVDELAAAQLDRDFLDPNPEGVPLEILPLDTDPGFHAMETERAKLKLSDPRRNARKIKDLEDDMSARAHELAEEQLAEDLRGVDAAPEGIPLAVLKVTEDEEFLCMVPQLRELKKDPEANKEQIRNLEDRMNNRAYELADGLLEGDRDYLVKEPEGVHIEELPLAQDDIFAQMEVERAKLKAQDPRRNGAKIADLEARLNARAVELARNQLAEDLRGFGSQYEGISTVLLKPHNDAEFASLVPELRRLKKDGSTPELREHMGEMDRRLQELAKELVDGDLWFLDKEPEGVPLEFVPLKADQEFDELQHERAALKANDPRGNADRIKDVENAMNDRAHELAKAVKKAEFERLDQEPYDIPLNLLPLREDPFAAKLIRDLRETKDRMNTPVGRGKVADLEGALNDRAQELAWNALAGEREKYLDENPEGVALESLPLNTDHHFHVMEVERAKLKLADPRGNAKVIEDLGDKLNDRAHELAKKQLEEDLAGLDQSAIGMSMDVLQPHRDAEFNKAAKKLRELKKDPQRNANKIRDLEGEMTGAAKYLMKEMLINDREFLDPEPEGVPLSNLPLDDDHIFNGMEVKRAELKAKNPIKNADDIAALENDLNNRAHELALEQLKEDIRGLDKSPLGVPLALLRPHDDATFAIHVPVLRQLKKDPVRNTGALRDLEDKLNDSLEEMAHEFLRADRESYLDPLPSRVPLDTLPLDKDPQFKDLETERLKHLLDPKKNKDALADLEDALNARAKEIAEELIRNDRMFLDKEPEGVPVEILPLDENKAFHELELKRAGLKAKDPVRNAKAIKDLEDDMNALVHELAEEQLAEDLRGLDSEPCGIPIELLQPHNDSKFHGMVKDLRKLKSDPSTNTDKIAGLIDEMNERAGELAKDVLQSCREVLDPCPEGLPLNSLPLDEDKPFQQIEIEMAKLKLTNPVKNAGRIDNLVGQLNDRASEIARAMKARDLEGLEQTPCGIPLALLKPHDDSIFASLASEARTGGSKSRSISLLGESDALNKRAKEIADQYLSGDRGYLDRDPEGIPLSALPLDTDPEFNAMEVERAVLKLSNPKKNADKIKSLEGRLNDRAHELARERLSGDRGFLDAEPEGVPLADLPLDDDLKFHQMEVERAKLKERDPVRNAFSIRALEDKLNDQAHELAKKILQEDLEGVDTKPEGVPLLLLQPHKDAEFLSFLPDLRRLKKDPKRNATAISGLQDKMNDRVHELARDMIAEGRKSLDPEPEGVPLELLPLDSDKKFSGMEKELYALQAAPRRDDAELANLRGRLNDRAHELAKEKIQGDRGFLNAEQEGVPLADLLLDDDLKFNQLERQRAKLKDDPVKNASSISRLEDELNDRAHELAKELKKAERSFLNARSYGIPKELLPLDRDRNFLGMEQQLRRLKQNTHRNAVAIQNLRDMMQDRADELGLQMLKGDRPQYLDPEYEGVEIVDIPIDDDSVFTALELERAILKGQDPVLNKGKIGELERKLGERAKEMAKERINRDRMMLNAEPEGIPLGDLPLDDDTEFKRREGQLRKLCRDMRRNGRAISDMQDLLNDRAHELARDVVADDLKCLRDAYRGIPKEGLNLHKDKRFKELANRRRTVLSKDTQAANVSAIERAMDARACEIADDVVDNERAFLDRTPEGMDLADVPLDNDDRFATMEAERRKLSRDPRSTKRNRDIIRDLECDMNERAHELALEEFGKMRGFMDQEPEGVPLKEIPLNMDADFRNAEVERYRIRKGENKSSKELAKLEKVMNDRAHELAKAILARDRGFLDPEPEGVPLEELPLNTDEEFNKLAGKRRRLMGGSKKSRNPEVKDVEGKMNDRAHELANEYLQRLRGFLDPEPEGVPLEDVPLNRDPAFLDMERELIKIRKDPNASPHRMKDLEEDMNARARELAKDLVRKERAYLDPEPYGVLLADLPLNNDAVLKPLERQRRLLKKDPKRNGVAIRGCEEEIQDRVREIAKDFVEKERAFLDPQPEGVPLSDLPLDTDRLFREMENELRTLRKQPTRNGAAIADLENQMNARVNELAMDVLQKSRAFLDSEPLGVPLEELLLNDDEEFHEMETRYRELKKRPVGNADALDKLENDMNNRARKLAEDLLKKSRAFLDEEPEGYPLSELPLNKDKHFLDMEKKLRELKKHPRKNAEEIKDLEYDMNDRVHELARRQLSDDRSYLPVEIFWVPVFDLPLDDDQEFRELELQRHNLKKDPKKNADAIRDLEDKLNDRAFLIANDFVRKEREYLDQEPEGVPLDRVPLNTDRQFHEMEQERRRLKKDPRNKNLVKDLEDKLNKRAHELAMDLKGWQDEEFHEANKDMAELWPRIAELYPEGIRDPVVPEKTLPMDVCSAPNAAGYLAPFIAALSRHPPLIHRLFESKVHPVNGPYSFTFFDPNSNPVRVDIDDRVPVDGSMEPKFTRVPQRSWYPLLLEKAYAKFIGGYSKLDQCTPHETLRDLTGRPVLHIPFDRKLAEAANTGDFKPVKFWEGVAHDLRRGDVITCMSNVECEDGIHSLCSYALLGVILTVEESNDPADVVIKLHNCYFDEPTYDGPLHRDDPNWTNDLRRVCKFDYSREEHLFLPLPTFLKNFSSMQRCHINCGDRLSSPGEWNEHTAGGNPKYTTFRTNPIYLVENKSSRPVTIIAELRHESPAFKDKDGLNHYHQTGLVLMQSVQAKIPPTPLITNSTHRFIQRGMMLDAREVCSQMELPPNTTCYLIPYTMKRGCHGKFHVSVYPDMAKVTLTPLRNAGLNHIPLSMNVDVPSNNEGTRVDILLNEPCDVHVLVRQTHVSDPSAIKKSDVVAEDDIAMHVYNEFGIKVGSTVSASNAREQALIFRASQGGRYSVILVCASKPLSGTCPCTLFIYVTKKASAEFVPVPSDAKPLGQSVRFPIIPRSAPNPYRTSSRERAYSRDRSVRRTDSLPPLQGAVRGSRGSQVSGMQPQRPSKGHVHSRESV